MIKEQPQYQSGEKEQKQKTDVWIIDDDWFTTEGYIALWGKKVKNVIFHMFTKGEEALTEIKKRIEKKEQQPSIIFVDGELEFDQPDFDSGAKIISSINTYPELKESIIVAFSASRRSIEEMKKVGMRLAFLKGDSKVEEIPQFLSNPDDYLNQQSP